MVVNEREEYLKKIKLEAEKKFLKKKKFKPTNLGKFNIRTNLNVEINFCYKNCELCKKLLDLNINYDEIIL